MTAKKEPPPCWNISTISAKEPAKVDYYKMFEGKMPGGRALMSSTLTLPDAKLTSLKEIHPAKFDEL